MFSTIRDYADLIERVLNLHEANKAQQKGLRRLSRRVKRQAHEIETLKQHRQDLCDLLDSRDHDIQVLKQQQAELTGGGEPCDARR